MEVLGIDIGGTGIKSAIVNTKTGELVSEKHRIPTPEKGKPNDIADVIAQHIEHFNWKGKVGCGFPTVIHNGKALEFGNLHKSWKGTQVDELFSNRTNLEFTVINDADAAGLAAINFGADHSKKGFVLMITIGTGIGSGAFFNGQLIPNFELGSFPYKEHKRVEFWAADSARKREDLSMQKWLKRFNRYLEIIELMTAPELIILGGGISKKFDSFKDDITIKTPVVVSKFQNNVGIVGAALGAV